MIHNTRIAITLNTSWNIYNFRRTLINDLIDMGYSIVLFAPKDESSKKLLDLGYKLIELKELSRKGTNPINELKLVQELKRHYKKENIDLAVHFTIKPNIYGSIAASQIGIPSIAVVTGLGYTFLSNGIAAFIAKILYAYAFKRNNITIFQNPDDRKLFIEKGLVSTEKSRVIYGSGIDTLHFKGQAPFKSLNHQVLFIGRLLHDKGIRELLEGFKKYSEKNDNITLHIVGDIDAGNPASLSDAEITSVNHNRIVFHGFQSDVLKFIDEADLMILPSYREGLPRTMLEALAMSKPVITTDVPGCREVVKDGINGYLIDVKSADAISEALEKFYRLSIEEISAMGRESRSLALNQFDSSIVNKQYIEAIEEVLK